MQIRGAKFNKYSFYEKLSQLAFKPEDPYALAGAKVLKMLRNRTNREHT